MRLFRLIRPPGEDDLVHSSRHCDARQFWNPRCIQFQFRYFCGPGHARLRHFSTDTGTRRVAGLFSDFLTHHYPHDAEIETA